MVILASHQEFGRKRLLKKLDKDGLAGYVSTCIMIEGALDVISQSKMVFCLFTGMVTLPFTLHLTLLPYAPLSNISVDQDTNGNDSAFIQVTSDIYLYKHRVEPRRN